MQTDVVTGAFGYSGAAIARELRAAGHQVRTLTGHPRGGPGAGDIDTRPLDFSDHEALARDLAGAHTLYCTYWVRFPHGTTTRESAVINSKALFDAAARAGIERIVYVSILHADTGSPYPYFSGKGAVERHLAAAGVPYAIARPAILFGSSADLGGAASVLLNNIAWLLRRLPVFGIGDGGGYRIRPIHVDDLAQLCVELGGRAGNVTVDAVGPDAPTFREMVTAIRSATGSRALLVPAPGWLIPPLAAVLGAALRDVLLTPEEYQAMAAGLATSDAPPAGQTSLMDWISGHGDELGRVYANELDRHYRSPVSLSQAERPDHGNFACAWDNAVTKGKSGAPEAPAAGHDRLSALVELKSWILCARRKQRTCREPSAIKLRSYDLARSTEGRKSLNLFRDGP